MSPRPLASGLGRASVSARRTLAAQPKRKRYTVLDLFRSRGLRHKALTLFFCWLSVSFVYFGLSLSMAEFGGDPHWNVVLSGLVEIPVRVVVQLVLPESSLGRRWSAAAGFLTSAVALLITLALDVRSWGRTALAAVARGVAAGTFAIMYLCSNELMPTVLRNVGVSYSSMMARFGAIVAPLVNELGLQISAAVPALAFGAAAAVSGVLCLFLPETLGRKYPETVAEAENVRLEKFFSLARGTGMTGVPWRWCRGNRVHADEQQPLIRQRADKDSTTTNM